MKFKKTDLQEALWGDHPDFTIIRDVITGNGRWSIQHELVFSYNSALYRTSYEVGATEMQDERPFEYEGDEIECTEVIRYPKLTYEYIRKTDENASWHLDDKGYIPVTCQHCFQVTNVPINNMKGKNG